MLQREANEETQVGLVKNPCGIAAYAYLLVQRVN
jgi:hypothetical protein